MNDLIEDVGTIILLLAWVAQMATPFALAGLAMWLLV